MPLYFNTLIAQTDIEPANVRLLRHQDNRAAKGRTPYGNYGGTISLHLNSTKQPRASLTGQRCVPSIGRHSS